MQGGRSHAKRRGRGNLGEKKGWGEEEDLRAKWTDKQMDGLSDSLVSWEPACMRRVSSP